VRLRKAARRVIKRGPSAEPAEYAARSNAARLATANNAIEGLHASRETEAILDSWARGEIDDDELMEVTLRKYGPGV
jgi:hypothetical protein